MNSDHITGLSGTPASSELSFRRWRDRNDYLQMAAVRAGSCEWDQVDLLSAREDVPTAQDLSRHSRSQRCRIALIFWW